LYEKVHPYLRPLYDALYDMLEAEKVQGLMEKGAIEIAPLAYMRGRTLNDAFIILDEAQNSTTEQMKMFLTRLGFNSKMVITGDITQVDLPASRGSGLIEVQTVLRGVEGIEFVYFDEGDVVRHRLVSAIVRAYDVLAFPLEVPGPSPLMGQIVISADTARRQARRLRVPLPLELDLLVTHGVLHLAGYDDRDPVEAELMHGRERQILVSDRRRVPARLWKGLLE